ncbi:MAG: hypothetical protein AABM64_06760 [Pseudomonadota bacterium]
MIKPDRSVIPALTPEQEARARFLTPLLDAARQYVNKAAQASLEVERVQRGGRPVTPGERTRLNSLIKEQADLGLAFQQPLAQYLTEQAQAQFPNDEDKRLEYLKKADPIFPVGRLIDMEALGRFIRDEISAAAKTAARQKEIAETQGAVYLRIRATHAEPGRPEAPLHVQPYDKFEEGNVEQEPAVSFKLTDEDRTRLQQSLKVASDAAQFVRDVRNSESGLRKDAGAFLASLRSDLGKLRQAVDNLADLDAAIKKLANIVEQAGDSTALTEEQKKRIGDFKIYLEELKRDVNTVREKARPATQPAGRPNEIDTLLRAADDLSGDLVQAAELAMRHATEFPQRLKDLQSLLSGVQVDDAIRPLVETVAPNAVADWNRLVSKSLGAYPALVQTVKSLAAGTRPAQLVDALAGLSDDPDVYDMPFEDAPDGTMSLARNIPRGPEIVRVETQLVSKDTDGRRRVLRELPDREFAVDKFGLVSKWSGNLIFVKREGEGETGDPKINFDPAPGLSWTLHYVPLTGETSSAGDKAWKFLNPGAGLSLAALDFEDKGVQLGIGVHLTLFNDLLQLGYGYNLNAGSDPQYIFIGIGFTEGINQLSGMFGGNSP